MITSHPSPGERVVDVRFGEDTMSVDLADGRTITVPLVWFPRLVDATPNQRANWRRRHPGQALPPEMVPAKQTNARPRQTIQTTAQTTQTAAHDPTDGGFCKLKPEEEAPIEIADTTDEPMLTSREQRLVALVSAGNKSVAACLRECGYGNGTGHASGEVYRRINHGDLRKLIRAKMAAMGALPEIAIAKHLAKLDAKETKLFAHEGVIVSSRDLEAHSIQLEASRDILKAYGAFDKEDDASAKQNPAGPIVAIQFNTQTPADPNQTAPQTVTTSIAFQVKGNGTGHG